MRLEIVIPGVPTAKGRPKFSRQYGKAYTPSKTRIAEETMVARAAAALAPYRGIVDLPLSGPLNVNVIFVMPVPASWSAKKKAAAIAGEVHHTSKPDLDNLAKLMGDALNNVAWKDDSQIIYMSARKIYGEEPRTALFVSTVVP